MEVVFLQKADADVEAAYEWHGGFDSSRAEWFLDRLNHSVVLLRDNPLMGARHNEQFRRLILPGFTLGVFYTVTSNRILVARVLDLRQDPENLRRQLEE